jgi:hypothetical protein
MKHSSNNYQSGLTLVEVVVACSIILVAVITLIAVHSLYLRTALANGSAVKAAYLAEEGIEAMRYLRDDSWDTKIAPLSAGVDYGVAIASGTWVVSAGANWVDGFERRVTVEDVYRDVSGDIVSSGGILDPGTKLVVATIAWVNLGATTTKSISTYLSDIHDN